MNTRVAKWRELDNICYVTKGVEDILKKITSRKYHYVSVRGADGSGKATAIRHAALYLRDKFGYFIYPVSQVSEFMKYFDRNRLQVFVFDYPFNDDLGDIEYINEKETYNDTTKACSKQNTKTKVLIPLRRKSFFDPGDVEFPCLFKYEYHTINMDEYKVTKQERKNILRIHLKNRNVSFAESEINAMISKLKYNRQSNTALMFPLLSKIYSEEPQLIIQSEPKLFFNDPIQKLIDRFEQIMLNDRYQFCGLVLCMMFGGKLPENMLSSNLSALNTKSTKLCTKVVQSCGLELDHINDIKLALNSVDGNIIIKIGNTYEFTHYMFQEIIIYHYDNNVHLLEHGPIDVVRSNVRINQPFAEDSQLVRVISGNEQVDILAHRLVKELKRHPEYVDKYIQFSPVFEDDVFLQRLKSILYRNNDQVVTKTIDKLLKYSLIFVFNHYVSCLRTENRNGTAVISGYKFISVLVEVGANTNTYIDVLGCYPIHLSILIGRREFVELLVNHGADVSKSYDKNTLTFYVKCFDKPKFVNKVSIKGCLRFDLKTFINQSKEYNSIKVNFEKSQSIIHFIFKFCKAPYQIAKKLLMHGADVSPIGRSGESLLHTVIRMDNVNSLQLAKLLLKYGANVNSLTDTNESLLHYIVKYNNSRSHAIAELLIENGIDVNARQDNGETALHYVVRFNHQYTLQLGQLLVKSGANLNAMNKYMVSVLHLIACCQDNNTLSLAELMVSHGANLNLKDEEGYSVLQYIVGCNGKKAMSLTQLLIKNGVDFNVVSKSGMSVLQYLAYYTNDESMFALAKYLLKSGADVEYICKYGGFVMKYLSFVENSYLIRFNIEYICQTWTSVLHLTVLNRKSNKYSTRLAKLFIDYGAPIDALDRWGDSALNYAFRNINSQAYDIAKMFITRGAELKTVCKSQKSLVDAIVNNSMLKGLLLSKCRNI